MKNKNNYGKLSRRDKNRYEQLCGVCDNYDPVNVGCEGMSPEFQRKRIKRKLCLFGHVNGEKVNSIAPEYVDFGYKVISRNKKTGLLIKTSSD